MVLAPEKVTTFLSQFAFLPFKHTQKKLNLAKINEVVAIEEGIKEGI
jgi:hypothetical protein